MSRSKIEMFEKLYESTFSATANAAANVPEDKRLNQSKDGKAHPLWLMGHLTFAADTIVNAILLGGDMTLPEEYRKVFAPSSIGGAPISTDTSAYPAWDDVLAKYGEVTATTLKKLKEAQDSDLPGGMKGNTPPGFEDFFKSFEGVLGYMMQHDTYHRGQMNLLANA